MVDIAEILAYRFAGNLIQDYAIAFAVFLITFVILEIFKSIVIKKLREMAKQTHTTIDNLLLDIIDRVKLPFYALLSLFIAIQFLTTPQIITNIVFYALIISATYYVIVGLDNLIDYFTGRMKKEQEEQEGEADTSILELINKAAKIGIWVIGGFFVLTNLGFEITPLIAGLGIGGVAIAFALQNVLGDIFASISIYFDKPFKTGDFIIIGEDMGTVKHIGIKSTRIQTLQGQELVVSNRELTETRVHNYKKMEKRRVVFTFGVTYQTTSTKVRKVLEITKDIIDKIEMAELSRVHFKQFGDFALLFEVVYYVNSKEYMGYMDTQQEINLKIKEQFEKAGIEMAYPTQTVYVHGIEGKSK
jgi:small-conductance mechanosensitive channel